MTELFQKIFAYAGGYPLASYYNTGYRGEVNCKKGRKYIIQRVYATNAEVCFCMASCFLNKVRKISRTSGPT